MQEEDVLIHVSDCINILAKEFQKYPYSFSSEGDIQCRLFNLIASKKELVVDKLLCKNAEKSFLDCRLHAEFSSGEANVYAEKKGKEMDLVILNRELDTILIGIEIKFKNGYLNSKKIKEDFEEDFRKLMSSDFDVKNKLFLLFSTKKWIDRDLKVLRASIEKYPEIKIYAFNKNKQNFP